MSLRTQPLVWIRAGGSVSKSLVHQAKAMLSANSGSTTASWLSYVVMQVVLKEKFLSSGSGNLTELEQTINGQAALGYRLHTITTSASGSKGLGGGDRIQATLVFERIQ